MIIVIHFLLTYGLIFLTNAMIQNITTKDSKQFHVNFLVCKNITFEHFIVYTPGESPNTDGIHIERSNGVNVLNTEIKTGDDYVLIGDGSTNLVINGVTCGPGHDISIGNLELFKNEEPVDPVTVKNYTMTNTSNGVRIKGWLGAEPDTCSNIHFEDILHCENLELANIEITYSGPTGPAVSQCLKVKPKVSGKQNPVACSAPIPAKPTP
ncbi:hypothetical protein Gotur_025791, partial [Gossypium turneri]